MKYGYRIKDLYRPNKTARGMTQTIQQSERPRQISPEALKLSVHGTTDELARSMHFYYKERVNCPCCGSSMAGKWRIKEKHRAMIRQRIAKLKNKIFNL